MADLLTSIRVEIEARMRELQPAVAEYERLSTAAEALIEEGRSAPRAAVRPAPQLAIAPARSPARKVASARREIAPARRGAASARRGAASARPESASARGTARGARGVRGRERPTQTPTAQAILAALEHGSHTLAELVVVTALRASDIRESLRRLRVRRAIVKIDRDGKSAYALPS